MLCVIVLRIVLLFDFLSSCIEILWTYILRILFFLFKKGNSRIIWVNIIFFKIGIGKSCSICIWFLFLFFLEIQIKKSWNIILFILGLVHSVLILFFNIIYWLTAIIILNASVKEVKNIKFLWILFNWRRLWYILIIYNFWNI